MEYAPFIISVAAFLFGGVLAAILKVMLGRAFKSIDDQIKLVKEEDIKSLDVQLEDHEQRLRSLENYKSALDEYKKRIEDSVSVVKADIGREVKIVTSHLDSIHKKIDHLDEKLDRLSAPRRGQ